MILIHFLLFLLIFYSKKLKILINFKNKRSWINVKRLLILGLLIKKT